MLFFTFQVNYMHTYVNILLLANWDTPLLWNMIYLTAHPITLSPLIIYHPVGHTYLQIDHCGCLGLQPLCSQALEHTPTARFWRWFWQGINIVCLEAQSFARYRPFIIIYILPNVSPNPYFVGTGSLCIQPLCLWTRNLLLYYFIWTVTMHINDKRPKVVTEKQMYRKIHSVLQIIFLFGLEAHALWKMICPFFILNAQESTFL